MKNPSLAQVWFTICLIALVVFTILYVIFREQPVIIAPTVPDNTVCTESATKTDGHGNLFTCIGGEWIYTGSTNGLKE